jgi:hypothetical protein
VSQTRSRMVTVLTWRDVFKTCPRNELVIAGGEVMGENCSVRWKKNNSKGGENSAA